MIYFLSSVFFSHFTFNDLFFHFSLLQIKIISWSWFRIQLNKPISWPPTSFLNLMPPKVNSVNHVNQLAGGNHLRAHTDQSCDHSGLQLCATPPQSSLCWPVAPEFPGGPSFLKSRFWSQEPKRSPHPASFWPLVHFVTLGKGCFSLTKNNWNAYPAVRI